MLFFNSKQHMVYPLLFFFFSFSSILILGMGTNACLVVLGGHLVVGFVS